MAACRTDLEGTGGTCAAVDGVWHRLMTDTLDLDDYEDEFKELERIIETECEELLEDLNLPGPDTPEWEALFEDLQNREDFLKSPTLRR